MPDFVVPEFTRLIDEPPDGANWVHEAKFDGYRLLLRVEKGRAVLRTRKGLDWTARFPEVAQEAKGLPDCMIDGEVCALEKGMPNFAALQAALSDEKTGDLIFYAFDLLFLDGQDFRELPLSARKERLERLLNSTKGLSRFRYVEHFVTPGKAILESACRTGLEGIVSKRLDAPYQSGGRDFWTKAKCRGGQEIVIGGWWGDTKKLRSILIGAWRGDDFVYMGRIGTGFNSQNSGSLLHALRKLERPKSPFTAGVKPPRTREIHWVEPKLVAEVEFTTITSDGLLRQASFKALREDKPANAITLEKPVPVEDAETQAQTETEMAVSDVKAKARAKAPAAKAPSGAKPSAGKASVAGIAISHPEKILWPATKTSSAYTKLDLARYYEMAAPLMLPHIAKRPISMVRAPEGIEGERFFQRHVLAGVGSVIPMKVYGEKNPYHALDSVEGLVALGQAAVLEIHPWGCKPGDPETPERIIFDLDPAPDVSFDTVIDGAKEVREVLELCGFTPFVKTTGGKGIHVVVAIAGTRKSKPTWAEAKEFARLLAEAMVKAAPDRYIANMSKKLRGAKIFLDYLRNDRSATAVAPFSPRARPGATIATTLAWRELKKGLDPASFNLGNAKAVIKRGDPWKDLAASAASLADARKKLDKAGLG